VEEEGSKHPSLQNTLVNEDYLVSPVYDGEKGIAPAVHVAVDEGGLARSFGSDDAYFEDPVFDFGLGGRISPRCSHRLHSIIPSKGMGNKDCNYAQTKRKRR
jgi:hypothetical protein